jgi:hypothetical protein
MVSTCRLWSVSFESKDELKPLSPWMRLSSVCGRALKLRRSDIPLRIDLWTGIFQIKP